jgi:PPOX class probable F420-dependent enzyme
VKARRKAGAEVGAGETPKRRWRRPRKAAVRAERKGTEMEAESPYRRPRQAVLGGGGEGDDVLSDRLASELLDAPLIANLATVNPDGSIHLVAMWFLWDGEAILSPTHARTRKAKNLQRDHRATVMIDDSRGGFDLRGLTLVCRGEIVGAPASRALNRRIHLKYVTQRGLELEPVKRYLATDDVTLRLRPTRISSWDLRETAQGRALLESGEYRRLTPQF